MTSHILVIDDEESLRFTLETFLQDEGYMVSTADSFPAAEELLKQIGRLSVENEFLKKKSNEFGF